MLINNSTQATIDRIFSAPLDYDEVAVDVGETPEEPAVALNAYKDGKLVYYINYELVYLV